MKIFNRGYEINPYPVCDKVVFRNMEKTLVLTVRADSTLIVSNLNKVNKRLNAINDDTSETEKGKIAEAFASAIFGNEQAEKLLQFYDNDSLAVITSCGKYFQNRLSKLITKAQKKG